MRSSTPDNVYPFPSLQTPPTAATALVPVAPETQRVGSAARPTRRYLWLIALLVAGLLAVAEARTSYLQSLLLSRLVQEVDFGPAAGPGASVRFPVSGPYDERLGYTQLAQWTPALEARGYVVAEQARLSPRLERLVDSGIYALYREKQQAGLEIGDRRGTMVYAARYPRAVYQHFEAIPPVIVNTLAFIEDRAVLATHSPRHNPAIAWERLGRALLDKGRQLVNPDLNVVGGSTLATQLEKFRHSDRGITATATEKLRQVSSASLRSYLQGPDTLEARREIVRAYLNGVPLAARAGHGEVHGLLDGLRLWFDADPAEVNRLLDFRGPAPLELIEQRARAYRQVLSLLLAQQRPTWFLGHVGFHVLAARVDEYTRVLAREGIIDPRFRDAVLAQQLEQPGHAAPAAAGERRSVKTAYMIRSRLLALLGLGHFYDLDRLDLRVVSTLDYPVQRAVAARLLELRDPEQVRQAKLTGHRLLESRDKMDRVIYSFSLYEATEDANLLRVQADNYAEPFDINDGVRLDLGSTAKLRTLVHYLEIMASLYGEYAGLSAEQLRAVDVAADDALRAWMIDTLQHTPGESLRQVLDAAMERRYSASPAETFLTGGGAHRFANFRREDNGRIVSVREAFRDSVNLPFVRMMRDIVRYHTNRSDNARGVLENVAEPRRVEYLTRFADREGKVFLRKFYRKYAGKTPAQRFELLVDSVRAAPVPLSVAFRSVHPDADQSRLGEFLGASLHGSALREKALERLYRDYAVDRYSLMDRGYLAKVHPLELWLVAYLQQHPEAQFDDCVTASAQERIDVYAWLFKTRDKGRQDKRIRSLLEMEAFNSIHAAWARLGYPFSYLTPSYATAIGSSADRPAALAELMGIIVRGGIRAPVTRLQELHFGAHTPYETRLRYQGNGVERVLPVEVAGVLHAALLDVVARGTAVRLAGGVPGADGVPIPVGGKTGTGDHRYEVYDAAGRLVQERVVNRTATFVFFIGERFYGTVSAYVPGEDAASFSFTSSLPVELLRQLGPLLLPLTSGASGAQSGEPSV